MNGIVEWEWLALYHAEHSYIFHVHGEELEAIRNYAASEPVRIILRTGNEQLTSFVRADRRGICITFTRDVHDVG